MTSAARKGLSRKFFAGGDGAQVRANLLSLFGRKGLLTVAGVAEGPGDVFDFVEAGNLAGAELVEEFERGLFGQAFETFAREEAGEFGVEVVGV